MIQRTFACVLALAAAGCVSVPEDAGFDDVETHVAGRIPQRVTWIRGDEDDEQVAREVRALLATELSADAAVQIALLWNRDLQASYEELGIAQADLVQAGLLKNPVFDAEVRFPAEPHHPLEMDVVQDFFSILFMPARKRAAEAQFEAAKLRTVEAVLELASRTRTTFYALQGAEQMLELRDHVARAAEASAEAARKLHEAGNSTELAFANERAAESMARIELADAEAEALDLREDLNVMMGLWGADTAWKLAARLPELPARELTSQGLEALALRSRVDLAAARHAAEEIARTLGISRYLAWGDEAALILHSEREPDGTRTVGPGIVLPIPLFDQGQAATARAEAQLRQALQHYAALAVEIRSAVRQARNRTLAARARCEHYRDVLIPLRTSIVDATQLEYNAMLVGVFELLQAKSAQIDAGRAYVEALRDYWIARTELERALGTSLTHAPSEPTAAVAPAADEPEQPPPHQHEHSR